MDKNGVVRAGTWNPKSRDDARSLLNAVTFGFIVTLVIVRYILNLTRPATVKLQSEEMDILKAEQEIATLQNAIKDMQKNTEGHHHRLFEEAVQLSQKVGIQRIETYALLDNGSKSTFCSRGLLERLRISGKKARLKLNTMGRSEEVDSIIVKDLEVSDLD